MKNIAIFASGSGSNAENIIKYFEEKKSAKVIIILTNNPHAYVLDRAARLGVPSIIFDRKDFHDGSMVLNILLAHKVDFIALAGFLWLVPDNILVNYKRRIINIHPALLPDFGGKGMYGDKVHRAVIEAGRKESGITIHYVNEEYDKGEIIFQAKCAVSPGETPESLAAKIHELEYRYYPEVIEKLILGGKL